MKREYVEIKTITNDGLLYKNNLLGTVESIIPNPYDSCHAADLIELPNKDILCCWFAGSDEGNADISIVLSRLKAGESRWSVPVKISDDATRSEQNPSLFLTSEGELWLMYTAQVSRTPDIKPNFNLQYTAEIRCKKSLDNGYTFGETFTMFSREGSFCRQKIQVLSNGRWVFGNWICFSDETRNGSDITVVQISDDNGKTFREVSVPNSKGMVHANIVEIDKGHLIALFRSRFADNIYISTSKNYGDSWSEPTKTELPNNNSSISAIKLKSGCIAIILNPVKYNDEAGQTVWPHQRCPVAFAISEDNGNTWPFMRIIENGEGFIGSLNDINNRRYEYPVMMQAEDETIHAAYTWGNRKNIKYVSVSEKWIRGEKLALGAENNPKWARKC